jgi:hypothetical protein
LVATGFALKGIDVPPFCQGVKLPKKKTPLKRKA